MAAAAAMSLALWAGFVLLAAALYPDVWAGALDPAAWLAVWQ